MDRRTARLVTAAAVILGVISQAWLFKTALGLNALLMVLAVQAAAFLLRRPRARIDRLDLWIPASAAAFAAFVAIRADPVLTLFNVLAAIALTPAAVAAIGGAALTRRSFASLVSVAASGLGLVLIGAREPLAASQPAGGTAAWRTRLRPLVPIVRGLLVAIPVVVIFVALFSAADAVFSRLVSDVIDVDVDLGEVLSRAVLAALIAWAAAGALVAVVRPVFAPESRSLGAAASSARLAGQRVGDVESVVLLLAVDVVFAVFVILQVGYLFGGADTLAVSGMTYSDYARRGFFELIAVGFLAGGLVAGLEVVGVRRSRAYLAAAVGLAALTLAVPASATLRLRLYQDAYGWTELRFYAYAAIAWLALGGAAMIVLLVRGRTRWLAHVLVVLTIVAALGIDVVGPQGHVARQNLARAVDPSLVAPGGRTGLDVWYLIDLGEDGVPVMVEARAYVTAEDRELLDAVLRSHAQVLDRPELTGWPAWNLARQQAREALDRSVGR